LKSILTKTEVSFPYNDIYISDSKYKKAYSKHMDLNARWTGFLMTKGSSWGVVLFYFYIKEKVYKNTPSFINKKVYDFFKESWDAKHKKKLPELITLYERLHEKLTECELIFCTKQECETASERKIT
jgi:hypothetical protein